MYPLEVTSTVLSDVVLYDIPSTVKFMANESFADVSNSSKTNVLKTYFGNSLDFLMIVFINVLFF